MYNNYLFCHTKLETFWDSLAFQQLNTWFIRKLYRVESQQFTKIFLYHEWQMLKKIITNKL